MTKSVHLAYTKGSCWRRVLDARLIEDYFLRNGFCLENEPAAADYNILVTCAFIEKTESIALRDIEHFKKYPGRLIISGCLPGINPLRLKKIHPSDWVGAAYLEKFDQLFPRFKIKFREIRDANKLLETKAMGKLSAPIKKIAAYYFSNFFQGWGFQKKFYCGLIKLVRAKLAIAGKVFYLRVSWGCDNRCTYCVEWKAVGRHRSKKEEICLDEFRAGLKKGFRKFALVADDPGAYGIESGGSLPKLINQMIIESPRKTTFIIDGLHPKWLIRDLREWLKVFQTHRIRYCMISLQSGDDQILRKMKRNYTSKGFVKAIKAIKKADPRLEIITQAIVGFPTETESAFNRTLKIIKEAGILNAVLFPYCVRERTIAAGLEPKVKEEIIARRLKKAKKFLGRQGIFHFHFEVDV